MLLFIRSLHKPVTSSNMLTEGISKAKADPEKLVQIRQSIKTKFMQAEKEYIRNLPEWAKRDKSHKARYGVWNPTRKLNRQQMQDLRTIKDLLPQYKTIDLANMFKISPEAVRRILKSSWVPNEKDAEDLKLRQDKRKRITLQWKQEMKNLKKANKNISQISAPKDFKPRKVHYRNKSIPTTKFKYSRNYTKPTLEEMLD